MRRPHNDPAALRLATLERQLLTFPHFLHFKWPYPTAGDAWHRPYSRLDPLIMRIHSLRALPIDASDELVLLQRRAIPENQIRIQLRAAGQAPLVDS